MKISSIITEKQKWLNSQVKFFESSALNIKKLLSEGTSSALSKLEVDLLTFGTYFGNSGVVELLKGNSADGIKMIADSIDFHAHLITVRANGFFQQTEPKYSIIGIANYLVRMAAIAGISDKWESVMLEFLHKSLPNEDVAFPLSNQGRSFSACILALSGSSIRVELPVFNQFIKNIDSIDLTNVNFEKAFENHFVHSYGKVGHEYSLPPFDIIPSEIVYFLKVRKRHGLQTQRVVHEFSEIIDVVLEIPRVPENALLYSIKELANRHIPNIVWPSP